MSSDLFENNGNTFLVNIRVWHKPMGWFMFVVFGLGGILVGGHPAYLSVGIAGLWSVLRKNILFWSASEKSWCNSRKNFIKWSETRHELSSEDTIILGWKNATNIRNQQRSSCFFILFKPFALKNKWTDDYYVQTFNTGDSVSEITDPIKNIQRIYKAAEKSINIEFDFSQYSDSNKAALLKQELGIQH